MNKIKKQQINPYVEIYHQTRAAIESRLKEPIERSNPWTRLARNIADKYGLDNVHFEPRFCPPVPRIPHDTSVIIGGAIQELCVSRRLEDYQQAGFNDVKIDQEITISLIELGLCVQDCLKY